jgi:tetratricopeptide (TPR) repeat protein
MISLHNACNEATRLRAQGRHKEVIALLNPVLARNPDSPALHLELYKSYYALEKWEEARKHIEWYLRQRPSDRIVMMNLGTVWLQLGEPKKAAEVLTDCLSMPQCPLEEVDEAGTSMVALTMHVRLGLAFRRLGQLDQAAEQWELVLGGDSRNALIHKNLADLRKDQQRFKEAAAHYLSAVQHGQGSRLFEMKDVHASLMESLDALAAAQSGVGRDPGITAMYQETLSVAQAAGDKNLAAMVQPRLQTNAPSPAWLPHGQAEP